MQRGQHGFTLIEVIIFLAISGLLLTMAILGSGSMARHARFSDTINALHSTMQRHYEGITAGVNTRPASGGCGGTTQELGTGSCLLLGKVISLANDSGDIIVRYVTGTGVADSGSVYQQIQSAAPSVQTAGEETYTLPWGAVVTSATRRRPAALPGETNKATTTFAYITSIAWLRSPNASRIVPYYFRAASTSASDVQTALTSAVVAANTASTSDVQPNDAVICIKNNQDWAIGASPLAAVEFGKGQGSAGIVTNFDPNGVEARC